MEIGLGLAVGTELGLAVGAGLKLAVGTGLGLTDETGLGLADEGAVAVGVAVGDELARAVGVADALGTLDAVGCGGATNPATGEPLPPEHAERLAAYKNTTTAEISRRLQTIEEFRRDRKRC